MSPENLYTGLKNLAFSLTPFQATELHRILDYNKDGYVDLTDWMYVVKEEGNPYL